MAINMGEQIPFLILLNYYCAAGILIFLNVCSGGMWSKGELVWVQSQNWPRPPLSNLTTTYEFIFCCKCFDLATAFSGVRKRT